MKYKAEDIAELYNQLAILLGTGSSLEECLRKLGAEGGSTALDVALASIKSDLDGGKAVNDIISSRQDVFPGVPPSAASVEVGALKSLFSALADKELWLVPFRKKLTQYLLYPVVIIVVISVIVFFLMVFVIPIFEDMFASFGSSLPAPTALLIKFSGVFSSFWYVFAALFVAVIFILIKKKDVVHSLVAALPVFGRVICRASVMEFAGHLGALMAGGIPVAAAAAASASSVTNLAYRGKLTSLLGGATDVAGISNRLKEGGFISGRAAVVLASCGGPEAAAELRETAEQLHSVVAREIEVLYETSSIILMILLGAVVGFIIIALYLPIFTLAGAV